MDINNTIEATKLSNTVHAPEYAPVKENEQVLLALGINADHIAALPMIVNTGNAFLLLEVKKADTLRQLKPDANALRQLAEPYGLTGFCIFVQEEEAADAACRIFLSEPGAPEKAHKELASGALACYLYDIAMIKQDEMVIHEGFFMDYPEPYISKVRLDLLQGKIQAWKVETRANTA